MCACRQKKSFLIEDILSDTKKRPYKNLSYEPTKPLYCSGNGTATREKSPANFEVQNGKLAKLSQFKNEKMAKLPEAYQIKQANNPEVQVKVIKSHKATHHDSTIPEQQEKLLKFNVITEVQNEMDLNRAHLESRRNTYPLYPTAMKPNFPWSYREPRFSYYSDPVLNSSLMRSQYATNRFVSHSLSIRQPYGFDRGTVSTNCCGGGWWGLGGRRKGGQVRFTGAQTAALERRFAANKYLSPDERRALANTLRLSDRQVKTWFQNRRAKWRRTTPESADPGSPASVDGSDDDLLVDDE